MAYNPEGAFNPHHRNEDDESDPHEALDTGLSPEDALIAKQEGLQEEEPLDEKVAHGPEPKTISDKDFFEDREYWRESMQHPHDPRLMDETVLESDTTPREKLEDAIDKFQQELKARELQKIEEAIDHRSLTRPSHGHRGSETPGKHEKGGGSIRGKRAA